MDPLSCASSILALIEVTYSLLSLCYKYKGLSSAAHSANQLIDQLKGLENLLDQVHRLLQDNNYESRLVAHHAALKEWATAERLQAFQLSLQHLEQKLQPSEGLRAIRIALLFPLRTEETEKALVRIEKMKQSLVLALSVDQSFGIDALSVQMQGVRDENALKANEQRLHDIIKWLAAPEARANQVRKQEERHSGTGDWLVQLDIYTKWLVRANSLFWLHGFPGSGKSILCSTAILHSQELSVQSSEKIAIFFYFDFTEDAKRSTENMIRSLIVQLARNKPDNRLLNETWNDSKTGKRAVTTSMLLQILFSLLEEYIDVIIVIDAIDEAEDPMAAVEVVSQIHNLPLMHVHVMLASRWSEALERSMRAAEAYELELSATNMSRDIVAYTKQKLARMEKWKGSHDKLCKVITERASGMFRLAACLIELLTKDCRTAKQLNLLLERLPPGLNAVYERILCDISSHEKESAKRMLEWLAFCGRPMSIEELTHAVAVDHANLQPFSYDDLDLDPFNSPLLRSSLVARAPANIFDVISDPSYYSSAIRVATRHDIEEIRLAHASVKEFVLGDAVRNSAAKDFFLDAQLAHRNIAETCVLYLLTSELESGAVPISDQQQRLLEWPLLLYAANFWPEHANSAGPAFRNETWDLIKRLFSTKRKPLCGNYGTWANALTPTMKLRRIEATTPLYYAASFGLTEVVKRLLEDGAAAEINVCGGRFESTPLQVAAYRGRLEVVKVLVAAGADPNITTEYSQGSTLYWAIVRGHLEVAKHLIEHSAVLVDDDWTGLCSASVKCKGCEEFAGHCDRFGLRPNSELLFHHRNHGFRSQSNSLK